jgi:hypothetical protein
MFPKLCQNFVRAQRYVGGVLAESSRNLHGTLLSGDPASSRVESPRVVASFPGVVCCYLASRLKI